jgi:XRE family aerobic/anaerobic benzoate catabolism transcriptional regulator
MNWRPMIDAPPAQATRSTAPSPATGASPADDDAAFLARVGRSVREARERQGMPRRALCQAAGISERYLAQLEAGEGNASILLLRGVAAALRLPLPELLGDRDPSVERRLVHRFLEDLPEHRLEDVLFRLMREFGREEAARKRRIALVGLRGAGKTTLGDALARSLGWRFVELDREIEREAGIGLPEVFLLYGEAGYRRIERRCLDRVLALQEPMVVAVGGGIVSEPETYNALLLSCFTVWIRATPDEHMSRVVEQGDLRPMQGNAEAMADLKRILAAREPLYRKADAMLDTAGQTVAASVGRLRQLVQP